MRLNIMKGRSWGIGGLTVNPGFELLNWGIRLTLDRSWGYWEQVTQVGPFWLNLSYIPNWKDDCC